MNKTPCPDRRHSPRYAGGAWSCPDCSRAQVHERILAIVSPWLDACGTVAGVLDAGVLEPDELAEVRRLQAEVGR